MIFRDNVPDGGYGLMVFFIREIDPDRFLSSIIFLQNTINLIETLKGISNISRTRVSIGPDGDGRKIRL